MAEAKAPEPLKPEVKPDVKPDAKPSESKQKLPEGMEFTKPTSQLDLEARQEAAADGKAPVFFTTVNPEAPDDSGFIATDPIYHGRANDTERPRFSEEGSDAVAEEAYVKSFDKPDHTVKPTEPKF